MMAAEFHFAKGMIKQLATLAMVAMAVGLSYLQKLCFERETAYSLFRAFVQLTVIGFLLQFIFSRQSVVCIAGHTAGQQAKHVPNGKYIAGASIFAGTLVMMLALVLLRIFPFTPRYIIPVAGMMIGNSMTVTGVTMKQLRDDIKSQINQVETALALGATPDQAIMQQVK